MADPVIIPTKVLPDGREIREFQSLEIQKYIEDAIATLPKDAHGAVILHADSNKNFRFSTVVKFKGHWGENWTLITSVAAKPGTKLDAQGAVRVDW